MGVSSGPVPTLAGKTLVFCAIGPQHKLSAPARTVPIKGAFAVSDDARQQRRAL